VLRYRGIRSHRSLNALAMQGTAVITTVSPVRAISPSASAMFRGVYREPAHVVMSFGERQMRYSSEPSAPVDARSATSDISVSRHLRAIQVPMPPDAPEILSSGSAELAADSPW
jgi:hypothetical protein